MMSANNAKLEFAIEAAMPVGFQSDPTMARAIGIKCPRCSSDASIVKAFVFTTVMTPIYGCKACVFRWHSRHTADRWM